MKPIEIIREPAQREHWLSHITEGHGEFVKVVVDVKRSLLALGGEFHAEGLQMLREDGSEDRDVWGANIELDAQGNKEIAFESLINHRPSLGKRSMILQDETLKELMRQIIDRLLL